MLEILKTSISNVGTFDIEPVRYQRIFDIESFKIDIDSSRYRRNIDIEVSNFYIVVSQYRRNIDIEVQNFDIGISQLWTQYRRNVDIEVQNFVKTSILLYPDVEYFSISKNAPSISIYDIEAALAGQGSRGRLS